ncbi:MAG: type II toxin-antitoxin system Phd/YefM family antitoxin [Lachnospiraceae bacterium]|jgi:prevent-host-death family protein|nr:type II toxin-antitoxin system Phd/YefM family antitoxin [Lachnospiraceae bacterium]
MIIKASTALRNEYSTISNLAQTSKEPIFITKNGEGDGVFMSIDTFEKREQIINLRSNILKAEQERIDGVKTWSIDEAREELLRRANES